MSRPALISLAIITVSAWSFIALEHLFPYSRGQKLFRKGWATDFFLYSIAQSYVLGLVIAGLIAWIDDATGASRLGLVSDWPLWLQVAFFLLTHDLYIYAFHRLQHRVPMLWRIHEAHHSVEDVDWLAGSRSHALEILINQTVEFAPIVLLGAPPEVALIKGTIDSVWGMFIHSNIDVRMGWLQRIINGPQMHRWHHSSVFHGYGFNYGTKLAIWDWVFGTGYLPAHKPPGYGLNDATYPTHNYLLQQLVAFRPRPSRPSDGVASSTSEEAG